MCKQSFHEKYAQGVEALLGQLRGARGCCGQPDYITAGGAAHLSPGAIGVWFRECGLEWKGDQHQRQQDFAAVGQKLGTYVWYMDVLVCDCDRPAPDYAHGGLTDSSTCPQCKLLWSGVVPAPSYVPSASESGEDYFRANVDIGVPHFCEEAELVWDIRLCCISLAPLHMVMHCDTRRAYWDETTRIFASGGGGCAIEVWLEFGNSGRAVTCLCLQPVRGIWKCDGRW